MLKRPTREPWPPARLRPGGDSAPEGRAYAPEGTEKKPIIFRLIGAMQRSRSIRGSLALLVYRYGLTKTISYYIL
ncbi:MAG: hypothetical protein ACQEQO_01715 [Thermodesulfobacteriota bacterium]